MGEVFHECLDAQHHGQDEQQDPKPRHQLHGRGGKRGDVGNGVFPQPLERPFRLAVLPLGHLIFDTCGAKSRPEGKRAEEGVAFGQTVEDIDHLPVEQLEIR